MTKRRKILISVAAALAVAAVSTLILIATYQLFVAEHFNYKAATNSFVFSTTQSYKSSVTVPANGTVQVSIENTNESQNDLNYNYSIIVVPTVEANMPSLSCSAGTRYSYAVDRVDTQNNPYTSRYPEGAIVYEGIDVSTTAFVTLSSTATEAVSATVYVVRDTGYDYYVGSYFDLQMSQQEYFHNFSDENVASDGQITNTEIRNGIYPFINSDDYANVYIVSDFEIPENFTYNVPCFLNLLDFDITLTGGDFEINHGYSGLFSIATLGGQINNFAHNFNIFTPNAYYRTETSASGVFSEGLIVTNTTNFTKASDNLDLDAAANADVKTAVLDDANAYIDKYLQHVSYVGNSLVDSRNVCYVANSIVLPKTYYNYGISYTYTTTSSEPTPANGVLLGGGTVIRGTSNTAVTFTARGERGTDSFSVIKSFCVIGTIPADVRSAYMDVLGYYTTENQAVGIALTDATDIFSHGVDIYNFTQEYAASTELSGVSALDGMTLGFSNNLLFFNVIYGANLPASNNAVTLDYSEGKIGVDGISALKNLIIKHDYYICSTTASIVETVVGSFGGEAVPNSFSVNFKGVTIDERNLFLDRNATEIYIGAAQDTFVLLNRTDDGLYIGSPEATPSKKVNATNLGLDAYTYKMYYMNPQAVLAVDAVKASSLTRLQKSAAMKAVFTNSTENADLNSLLTVASITGNFCSEEYSGRQLLGDSTAYFSYDNNGVLTMNSDSFVVYNGVLTIVGQAQYFDSETDEFGEPYTYYLPKTLYSPASGFGGHDLSYTESGIFSDEFRADRNWIGLEPTTLQCTQTGRWIENITYTVSTPSNIPNNYFSITETAPGSHVYTMTVTKENIPRENSIVNVEITITDGSTAITEKYSFIIPGIYLYQEDIDNIWIYLRMCQVYGETNGYLTVDSTQAHVDTFDCAFNTLNTSVASPKGYNVNINYLVSQGVIPSAPAAPLPTDTFSLGGVQYLTNTDKMIFDNIKIPSSADSLTPFSQFAENSLTELSLSNCGITDAMLRNNYPIYSLNKLLKVDLSQNAGITSMSKTSSSDAKYLLYRTITELNVDSCEITSLAGLENLVQLMVFECRNNVVKNFDTLTLIPTLSRVYIGNNPCEAGTDHYYGTHGNINVCNIVNLLHKDVEVYVLRSGVDTLVRIYEKNGSNYYYKGEIISNAALATAAADTTTNILSDGGYLITLEQEFLGVSIMSFFNYENYRVAATTYNGALAEIFPSTLTLNEYTSGGANKYKVFSEDITAAGTPAPSRTYRLAISFDTSSANDYRFKDVNYPYPSEGVKKDGNYLKLYREISFNVYLGG